MDTVDIEIIQQKINVPWSPCCQPEQKLLAKFQRNCHSGNFHRLETGHGRPVLEGVAFAPVEMNPHHTPSWGCTCMGARGDCNKYIYTCTCIQCIALYCIPLHRVQYISLHHIADKLHYTSLHHIAVHFATLHYTFTTFHHSYPTLHCNSFHHYISPRPGHGDTETCL